MINLKQFQIDIVDNAVDFFNEYEIQLKKINDKRNRKKFISDNGCILIEAPTGSGKTIMAGSMCNDISINKKIVWFWFAPFNGLVGQAEKTLREEFSNLQVRNIKTERTYETVRSGDIFVTTWASVATAKAESRKIRTSKEATMSIDNLISLLKIDGYKIGVVVDEAHHGFKENTRALEFYQGILDPDFTILVTATPRDRDIQKFKDAVGFNEVHKISVSRDQAVDAGLVKKGIRAIAYLSQGSSEKLIDYERTAYRHALKMHETIKKELISNDIDLEPLLLVQVESGKDSAENAKKRLIDMGMPEHHIAIHTSDEPDPDILALAADENIKVLIFKLSVAMGFDAPRAFALVSMRKSKDPDFGIQVVGRILRVHKKLQGKRLPEILNYGYVFLADYESQSGLTSAASRINEIKSELIDASSNLKVITIADDQGNINLIKDNQLEFWLSDDQENDSNLINDKEQKGPVKEKGGTIENDDFTSVEIDTRNSLIGASQLTDSNLDEIADNLFGDLLDNFGIDEVNIDENESGAKSILPQPTKDFSGAYKGSAESETPELGSNNNFYQLREDIKFPHQFKKEQIKIGVTENILDCVISHINFDSDAIASILERNAKVTKRDIEIFSQEIIDEDAYADLSIKEITSLAQSTLFENEYLNGQRLHKALIKKLKEEILSRGWAEGSYEDKIEDGLYIILVKKPNLLKQTIRRCLKGFIITENASLIDKFLPSPNLILPPAKLNIYKVFPSGMNRWEKEFARLIDNDTSGTILWWHRNEPRKPWGVSIAMTESKTDFWPDFIIGVKNRNTENNILLVEIKGNYKVKDAVLKAGARHKDYGNILMLHWKDEKEWQTVINNDQGNANVLNQIFRISIMSGY